MVFAAVRDISARLEFERNQKEKEKAEYSDRQKSRFLAAATHDLRQPLQSISSYLDALKLQVRQSAAFETITKLEKASQNMKGMLNVLLDISLFESGSIEPKLAEFNLHTLIDTVLVSNRPKAEKERS